MYRCEVTGRNSHPGDKCNKIVVATRVRTYEHWDHEREEKWYSQGTEVLREINATDAGLRMWESWNEAERAAFLKRLG